MDGGRAGRRQGSCAAAAPSVPPTRAVAAPACQDRRVCGPGARAPVPLRLRRALGHELADAVRLLPRFVAYLDTTGAAAITVEAALAWAQRPDAGPGSSVWARRMTVARGFARYMSGIDPATQVPPLGLVTFRKHWLTPFTYSEADVKALIATVPRLIPTPFRATTFQTMIGSLAATGMRVGEVIALGRVAPTMPLFFTERLAKQRQASPASGGARTGRRRGCQRGSGGGPVRRRFNRGRDLSSPHPRGGR